MDVLTASHGLASVHPSQPIHTADVESLPSDLRSELERLQKDFWVSTETLKEISHQFERELQDGLERYGANIVRCSSLLYFHIY
jgi:hexokinase